MPISNLPRKPQACGVISFKIFHLKSHAMKVQINHREVEVPAEITTLALLLENENLAGAGRAVAIDNKLAPRSQWQDIRLAEGMNITVIRAVCGG